MSKLRYIGKDIVREDAYRRVRGQIKFLDDMRFRDALYAKVLRSPVPHAVVKEVDVSDALRMPGVVAALTPFNAPRHRFGRTFSPIPQVVPRDRRIIDTKVRYVGDPVAAVAAVDEATAEEALERIGVEYGELPAVFSSDAAYEPDAPLVHNEVEIGDATVKIERNVGYQMRFEVGDRDKAYGGGVKVYEDTYRTHLVFNAFIERRGIVAVPAIDGGLDVWITTQSTHGTRYWLAYALGLPEHKVHVHVTQLGGAFGGKYNLAMHEPIVGLLALRTGKTVKTVETLDEDFTNTGRHPAKMDVRIAVSGDGAIEAMEMKAFSQCGAYADHMLEVVTCIGGWFTSSYRARYKYYEGYGVYTNLPVCGAMRGFGNPQSNFALESMMDEIAEDLGLDPIELRARNLPQVGDIFYGQGPTVVTPITSIVAEDAMRGAADRSGWYRESLREEGDGWIRARGFAVGHHTSGTGGEASIETDRQEGTGAIVKVNEDGTVNLVTSIVDSGGGEHQVLRKVCAETIGLRLEDVHVTPMSTDVAPFDMGTHASRGTFVGGLGVVAAAEKAKRLLLVEAAQMLGEAEEALRIEGGVITSKRTGRSVTVAEAGLNSKLKGRGLITAVSTMRPSAAPPSWHACFVEVLVDAYTGLVKVERVVSGMDVGVVVNPKEAEVQVHGGVQMGIGFALHEQVQHIDGRYVNANFLDYLLTRATDTPPTEVFFVDSYEPTGPFGARGMGEACTNPVASAVSNAVSRALGVRIKELPITPEKVLRLLGKM